MLLMTDGTVLCQDADGQNWQKLTPDATGDYVQGTWSPIAPMRNGRLYYASAVLADGRVFVAGGEYDGSGSEVELDAAEIYDPVANRWLDLPTPGWGAVGDAPSCVLADGRVLLGSIETNQAAIWDPATNVWSATGPKGDVSSEDLDAPF